MNGLASDEGADIDVADVGQDVGETERILHDIAPK